MTVVDVNTHRRLCPSLAVALLATAIGGVAAGHAQTDRPFLRLPVILAQAQPDRAADSNAPISDNLRAVERAFILQGLETSRNQAELARLAVSQATRSDVREFAQQLMSDYREINGALETIAQRKTVSAPLQPVSFSDRYRELAARSGDAFDSEYIREIAQANERALRLCEAAIASAKDSDVRDLAGSLLPVVREHVNRSTDLQKTL